VNVAGRAAYPVVAAAALAAAAVVYALPDQARLSALTGVIVLAVLLFARSSLTARRYADLLQSEREPAEATGWLDTFFPLVPQPLCTMSFEGMLIDVNPLFEETLGRDAAELISRPFLDLVHPDDLQATLGQMTALAEGRQTEAFENRFLRGDGTYVWMQWSSVPDLEGEIIYSAGQDITERKSHESELERIELLGREAAEATGRLDTFFRLGPQPLCTMGFDGRFLEVNPLFEEALGHTAAELIDRTFLDFVHPDDLDATLGEMAALTDGRQTVSFENRYRRGDGSYVWMHWNSIPDLEGDIIYSAAHDITERKLQETELDRVESLRRAAAEATGRLDTFFRLGPQALCTLSFDGTFLTVNPLFEEMLGYSAAELVSRPYLDFVHPDDVQATRDEAAKRTTGRQTTAFENRYRRRDGTYVWMLWNSVPDPDGDVIYAAVKDITERKVHEHELQRLAESLRRSNGELEAFAYTVSHDLKAPLVSIDGFAAALLKRASPELDAKDLMYLERLRANSQSLQRLIADLLSYARVGGEEDEQTVDANDVVRVAADAYKDWVTIDVVSLVPALRIHPVRLHEAVTNLIENALLHNPNRPDLRIEVAASAHNGTVDISVSDNGRGVPADEQTKMFELFTRGRRAVAETPDGTGVGLALVKKIAESSGGSLRYEAAPSGGALFVLSLPKGTP
jgi:PAS domain S-box-containing protein